eukprot:TRINITY_DN11204_c0_g1_i1.p1 TRINITY_DN11204_c0_g1~~TRINITY_DN11204_c0_g1_i1.p1  ORF type:complete len:230 (+),score=35.66 TRINITY_DN11204_c0_g1_i1:66-755(+)
MPAKRQAPHRPSAGDDLQEYQLGYPGKVDRPELQENIRFYKGMIPCRPHGDFVDNIHKLWLGDYEKLEKHHGYIQWLFPIREGGLNPESQELQLHEVHTLMADPAFPPRFINSYKLMLDFYGMRLLSHHTGAVGLKEQQVGAAGWRARLDNFERKPHNFLRLTRVLKSLGEFGFEHYKLPLLLLLIELVHKKHLHTCESSLRRYWIPTLRNSGECAEALAKLDRPLARR